MSTAKPLQWYDWNRTHPIASGVIRLYALWAQHGLTAFDLANGFDGTLLNNPIWVAEGIKLADDNSHVIAPTSPDIEFGTGDEWALSAWVYPTIFGTTRNIIRYDSGLSPRDLYLLRFDTNNKLTLQFGNTGGTMASITSAGTVTSAGWHHVAGVVGNGRKRVYLDGVETDAADNSTAWNTSNSLDQLSIGIYGGTIEEFVGIIGEVVVYSRVLSVNEISELYAKPYLLLQPPVTSVSMYFQAPAPPTGVQVGILHRGQLPGILARAG